MEGAELRTEFEALRADLMSIDEQLALRRRAIADWDAEYLAWRKQAINAKQRKTTRLLRVKQQLMQLEGA